MVDLLRDTETLQEWTIVREQGERPDGDGGAIGQTVANFA